MAWMGVKADLVATAIVASRSKVDRKAADRPDYVQRTLSRAYHGVPGTEPDAAPSFDVSKLPEQLTDDERQGILKELGTRFGVPIMNVIEYTGSRHSYEVVTEHGKFDLGTTDQLMNWRQFNSAIMQMEHRTLIPMKAERWRTTLDLLLRACEVKETGGSGDDEVWLRNYLFEYCRTSTEYAHDPKMEYPRISTEPTIWKKEGERYIHAASFKAWLKHETRNEERVTASRFAARMRALGCLPIALACRIGPKSSSFDVWQIPLFIWTWSQEVHIDAIPGNNGHAAPGAEPPPGAPDDQGEIDFDDDKPPF
jgi:hypothetical protein